MKKRRLLGFLLSLALMMTMMPALAFAQDEPDAENAEAQNVEAEYDSTIENAEAQDAAAEDATNTPKKEKEEEKHVVKTEDVAVQGDEDLYRVWVGNTQVTSDNMNDVLRDGGTVKYTSSSDGKSGTLTLNGAEISTKYYVDGWCYTNIHSEGIDLTIVLNDDNVVGDADSLADYAIDVCSLGGLGGNLIIQGSGTLKVEGGDNAVYTSVDCKIESGKVEATSTVFEAIHSYRGNCVISGGEVEATSEEDAAINTEKGDCVISGGKVTATSLEVDDGYDAIYAKQNIVISGGEVEATSEGDDALNAEDGDCVISGGKVTATARDDAIFANNGDCVISGGKVTALSEYDTGIYAKCNVNISGGKIEATSNCWAGINGYNNVVISGGTVDATVTQVGKDEAAAINTDCGNLTISGDDTVVNAEIVGTDESIAEDCSALCACNGIEISGGKVSAKARNSNTSEAIFADDGDIKISDAKVIAESDSAAAIYGNGNIEFKYTEKGKRSTYVEAKVTESNSDMPPAIISYGNLTKGENLAITTPKDGIIRQIDKAQTVVDMDGDKYATHAVIQPAAYKIDVADTTGGKVKTEPAKAGEGELVKVVTTPDEGNEVDKIVIVDEDGVGTDVTEKSAFTMGRSNVTVKVTFRKKIGPTITTIAKTSAKTTTVKWSWDKATDATSYKLAYRKAGSNEWKIKNTKKTKYVIKRQKLKGLYEYKVAAVTSDGDVWSDVSCRYFKGVQARARVSKGAIEVKWKKDKSATGYEILIAKSKKMNDAQVIQVAPTAKSYKVTGLEKGKYYVKVRPVKEYNGVTYTGVLCKARKVRIK